MKIRAYRGDSSSRRIYDPIYAGKSNPTHVYETLYTTVTKLSHVQVREHIFERF
jgi:hypothetical protein